MAGGRGVSAARRWLLGGAPLACGGLGGALGTVLVAALWACGGATSSPGGGAERAGSTASSEPAGSVESARQGAGTPARSSEPATGSASAAASATAEAAPPEPIAPVLSSDMVREVVRAHYADLGSCYQQGLERDPKLRGTVEVRLAIDGQGRVVDASAPVAREKKPTHPKKRWRHRRRRHKPPAEPHIDDAAVVACLLDKMRALRFPPSRRGLTNLVYPLVFATE